MPIKITYDPFRNILYETGEGEISYQEFVEHREMLLAQPIRPPAKTLVLCDYRNAQVDFSSDEMWRLKKMSNDVAESFKGARVAIVASDDFGFGMARMYSMASDGDDFEVEAFKTMAQACAWLGIDEPEGDIL